MSDVLQNQVTVTLAGNDVVVKKLSLRKIVGLSKALQDIPKEYLDQGEEKSNADFLQNLPALFVELLPKYADLVSETLEHQVTADQLVDADYDELFDLIEAFLEVNNIPKIMARVGKVKALATGSKKKEQAIG